MFRLPDKKVVGKGFWQKQEAGYCVSGKIFTPRSSLKWVGVKNIVFRKPDIEIKNRIPVSETSWAYGILNLY